MKKCIALLLALTVLLSLAACGGGEEEKTPSTGDTTPATTQAQDTTTPEETEEPAGTTAPTEHILENDGTIKIDDTYGSYSRNTECASVTVEFAYSNGEPVEFEEVWEMPAAEWGFSTTDTRYTLTIVTVYAKNNIISIDYSGITEDDYVRGNDITDITYTPVVGKEIKTAQGEILEGFTYEK